MGCNAGCGGERRYTYRGRRMNDHVLLWVVAGALLLYALNRA